MAAADGGDRDQGEGRRSVVGIFVFDHGQPIASRCYFFCFFVCRNTCAAKRVPAQSMLRFQHKLLLGI
jgi:hypothetical protein